MPFYLLCFLSSFSTLVIQFLILNPVDIFYCQKVYKNSIIYRLNNIKKKKLNNSSQLLSFDYSENLLLS